MIYTTCRSALQLHSHSTPIRACSSLSPPRRAPTSPGFATLLPPMTPPEPVSEWPTLSDDALVERFAGVTVWRANGTRAPHKPMLMLYALARLQRGQPRLATFAEIEERVGELPESRGMPVWRPALLAARGAPSRRAQ